jgi:hypothetical protein
MKTSPQYVASEFNGRRQQTPDISSLDVSQPFEGFAWISPQGATNLIDVFNLGNRRIRRGLVEFLKAQIKTGEWQEDHPQKIIFSRKPRLIDGQHRLIAISESGQSVIAGVVCGARDELREYIDTGTSRTLEDQVAFVDDLNLNRSISTLIVFRFWGRGGQGMKRKPSPGEARDLFVSMREALVFAATNVVARRVRGLSRAPIGLAIAEFYERDPERATAFTEALMQPDGPIQQARILREFAFRQDSAGRQKARECYLKSICAMKAFQENREVRVLRNAEW